MSIHVPPDSQELTARQVVIRDFIREFTRDNGYPPSVREIMDATGIHSPNGVLCHFKALRRKGAITWVPGLARSVRVLGDGPEKTLGAVASRLQSELPDGAMVRAVFRRSGTSVSYEHDGIRGEVRAEITGLAEKIDEAADQITMIEAARRVRGPRARKEARP